MPRRLPALLRRAHSCTTPGNNGLPVQKIHSGNRYRYEALSRSSRCSVDSSARWAQPRHQVQDTYGLVRVFGSGWLLPPALNTCGPCSLYSVNSPGPPCLQRIPFAAQALEHLPSTGSAGASQPLLLPGSLN